jgi:hypothetical protein
MFKRLLAAFVRRFGESPVPPMGRNSRCHCGSGKKYKRCCLPKDSARVQAERDRAARAGDNFIGGRVGVAQHALDRVNRYRRPRLR